MKSNRQTAAVGKEVSFILPSGHNDFKNKASHQNIGSGQGLLTNLRGNKKFDGMPSVDQEVLDFDVEKEKIKALQELKDALLVLHSN